MLLTSSDSLTKPLHQLLYFIDILLICLLWVSVVVAKVTHSSVYLHPGEIASVRGYAKTTYFCIIEVEVDRGGMTNV